MTRWNLSPAAARAYVSLLMCLRGSVCLYQGEELGLSEADVVFEDLQDPYGIEFWPEYKGRDGCRTPMPWESSNRNAGFTTGNPWLPISSEHLHTSVAGQEADPGAILHHYRKAIAFRHAHKAVVKGTHHGFYSFGNVLHFSREHEGQTIFCAFNLGDVAATHALPGGDWLTVGSELGSTAPGPDGNLHLGPWQVALALKT